VHEGARKFLSRGWVLCLSFIKERPRFRAGYALGHLSLTRLVLATKTNRPNAEGALIANLGVGATRNRGASAL